MNKKLKNQYKINNIKNATDRYCHYAREQHLGFYKELRRVCDTKKNEYTFGEFAIIDHSYRNICNCIDIYVEQIQKEVDHLLEILSSSAEAQLGPSR